MGLTINYEIFEVSDVTIYAVHLINGWDGSYIENMQSQTIGSHSKSINVQGWNTGSYALIFQFDDKVYSSSFVKQ